MSRTYYQLCPDTGIVGVFTEGVSNLDFILAMPQGHQLWVRSVELRLSKSSPDKTIVMWHRHYVSWSDMARWGYGTPDQFSWQVMDNVPEILQLAELLGE